MFKILAILNHVGLLVFVRQVVRMYVNFLRRLPKTFQKLQWNEGKWLD